MDGKKTLKKCKNVFNKYLAIIGCLHGLNRSHVPFMSSDRLRLPERSNQSFGDAAALEKGNIHIFMATRFPCDLHLLMANCISLWQHAFFYGKHACTSLKSWGEPHVCKKRGPVFLNSSELLGQTPIPVPNQKFKFRLVDNLGTLWESIGLCSLLNWKFIHIFRSWLKII